MLLDPDDGPRRERTWWSYDDEAHAWVMREALETRRHVLEARTALATIRAELPTTRDCDVDDDSAATGFEFGARVGSDLLSVVSTGGAAEARQIHDQVLATRLWLPLAFGGETSHWPASVVVIEDPDRRLEFFSRHPGVPEGGAAALAELGSCWIDGRLFVSRYDTAQRVDGAVFQTVGAYLRKVYGIDQRHGWLNQSLCNYLTAKVYGTHLSFWVTTDRYGSSKGLDWTERAPLSAGGWFELALPLLADDRPIASFARVLTFPTQQMTWEDVVVGYAFSAYLFEGRRDDLLEIAGRFGGREEKTAVVEDVLEMPLDAVRERLRAWIVAMRTVQR
ncbi:MAG: hypothetical protein R3F34_05400 [Planctomycetota bacterium]